MTRRSSSSATRHSSDTTSTGVKDGPSGAYAMVTSALSSARRSVRMRRTSSRLRPPVTGVPPPPAAGPAW
ncbi:hypothetical protein [Streptomyces montanus]|uniref:hypothetical protein n=1 Tax=Streptomyces montanus TaxID=2580423 RepID=UPI001BB14ABE|nr:hypothetical protein [Streptomyces montanus]